MPNPSRVALLLVIVLASPSAPAQAPERRFEVQDQIDLIEVDRRLIAVGAGGSLFETALELEERVNRIRSQGLLAVAATNARLLAATARDSTFKTLRLRVQERVNPPHDFRLEDTVVVVPLRHRVVALSSLSADWAAIELGIEETVERIDADNNLAVILTDRRALGFAAESGGFSPVTLSPKERIERVSIEDSSATIVTSRRILVFQAGSPRWSDLIRVGQR